jgi:ribonuclease HI
LTGRVSEPKNPGGMMGMGVYIESEGKQYAAGFKVDAKKGNTNNIAEYMAFIRILELMKNKVNCNIEIFGDSMLVINQMNGEWNINAGAYSQYAITAGIMLSELKKNNTVKIEWIRRNFNEKADEQSRKAIGNIKGKY